MYNKITFLIIIGSPYLSCKVRNAFLLRKSLRNIMHWLVKKYPKPLSFLLGNIFIRFGTKLNRQEVGIHLVTNCALLIASLFLFYYERDFMMSLPDDTLANIIDFFITTSSYLDDILQKGKLNIHFRATT